ncbi:TPA: sensor domain-containing diguanylate cyclase [Enterobacter hormaechei]|uniref:sensor domain-containing diguanylate cyclase n=1 Tax=Enterobacter TaxID=547 RepID=UPI000263C982|nr:MULTISPECIES: sensor domain-containing diguanylate cyclase [Enterobacter cloacae complex]EIM36442.1 AdrA [Enterobacter cloacae subsp. cloacae GS1]RYA72388.1 sensor domain-containing diguanylate cyclase [Enterobacter cloacae complex sp. 2DZ2F16B1]AOP91393.1 diguanylate cyclase [Enterobacter hormaechei subsp. xiangfangensis]EHN8841846.1 sensor domain-containing diguanylate cyclase [Enterobacter hormaechei]EJD7030413.1 sensor domain-containing diguanylate cyclase [Enterobacter hormaechei]
MKAPQIPVNEAERMNALRESGLLEIDNYPAFDRLTRLATRFFRVPLAMITLVDDHAAIVKSADGRALASQPRDLSFCGHTILGDAPLVVSDTLLDERFADNPQVAGGPGVRFYAGFPLRLRDGACVGSLCLIDYAPREFTAADAAVLADLSALAEDEFAAVSAATTDELTGLFNRRGFNQFAQFALSVSQRRAEPLTLGWLDLDHFKTINDRFGHQEGDKALKAMAALMRSSFREADLLVRFGGDEFAVLFADTDEPGAWIAMQYLVEQTEKYNARQLHPWSLQFSWGLSEFDHHRNDIQAWLKHADAQMYAMKRQHHGEK